MSINSRRGAAGQLGRGVSPCGTVAGTSRSSRPMWTGRPGTIAVTAARTWVSRVRSATGRATSRTVIPVVVIWTPVTRRPGR